MKQNIKQKSVKYFAGFLVFMLICTIVSRGIYAYQMPRVTLGASESRKLTHKIEAQAVTSAGSEHPLNLLPGLRIAEICVREGQKVEPQEVLLKIDMTDLEDLKKQSEEALAAAQATLSDLQESAKQASSTKNAAISRANQDLADTAASSDAAVGAANSEYQAAQDALASCPSREDYVKKAEKEDAEYQKLLKEAKKKDATKEEKNACKEYQRTLREKAESDYEAEKQALQDAVAEKAAAVAAANASKSEQMKQAARAVEDAEMALDPEQGSMLSQQKEISELEKTYNAYQKLLEENGEIKSDTEGYISRILTAAGDRTADSAALMFAETSSDFLFTANVSSEDTGYVGPGDAAVLSFPGGENLTREVTIDSMTQSEDGSYQVSGKVSGEGLTLGQSGTLTIEKQTKMYDCCVPLSALYADNGTTCILMAEEQDTILGKEWVAKKRNVKVADKDGEYAALEDTAVTSGDKLVVSADRQIADGQRIRLVEE